MTRRQRRMLAVGLIFAGTATAVALSLRGFSDNILYFYTPTQVMAGEAPQGRAFRVGGLVTAGSLQREEGSMKVQFTLTDNANHLPVSYEGLLPDLFREGQGVIARGAFDASGQFAAKEVLAKHDENYMPPEVAEALKAAGHPGNGGQP